MESPSPEAPVARKGPKCSVCGAALTRQATACEKCGTPVGQRELDTLVKALHVDRAKVKEKPAAAEKPGAALFLCGECGAFVDATAKVCDRCGAEITVEEEVKPQTPAEAPGGLSSTTVLCGQCGATMLEGMEACAVCGSPMTPTTSLETESERGPAARVCETCGAELPPDGRCRLCAAIDAITSKADGTAARQAVEELESLTQEALLQAAVPTREEKPAEPKKGGRRRRAATPEPVPAPAAPEVPVQEPAAPRAAPEILEISEAEVPAPEPEAAAPAAPEAPAQEAPAVAAAPAKRPVVVPAQPPPRPRTVSPRFLRMGERSIYASGFGLVLGAVAALSGMPGREWVLLFVFSTLFGTAASMLGVVWQALADRRRWAGVAFAGMAVTGAAPLRWYAGLFSWELDVVLLAAGSAVLLAGTWMTRHPTGVYVPWTAGLYLLMLLSLTSHIPVPEPQAAMTLLLWAFGGTLVASAIGLLLQARLVESRVRVAVAEGRKRHERLDAKGSIRSYDKAIRTSRWRATGASDDALTSKAAALVLLGRNEEALKLLDEALKLNPGNEVAWLNRGNALARTGELQEALWCYNQALRANPRYEVAWNNKGNTLARMGNYVEALKCYEKALDIDREYRGAWVNKGFVLAKLGYYEEAALCADRALAISGAARAVAAP